MTAINDGSCKSDNPLIACPEVQPPAYLLPIPTISPPIARIKNPLRDKTASKMCIRDRKHISCIYQKYMFICLSLFFKISSKMGISTCFSKYSFFIFPEQLIMRMNLTMHIRCLQNLSLIHI